MTEKSRWQRGRLRFCPGLLHGTGTVYIYYISQIFFTAVMLVNTRILRRLRHDHVLQSNNVEWKDGCHIHSLHEALCLHRAGTLTCLAFAFLIASGPASSSQTVAGN